VFVSIALQRKCTGEQLIGEVCEKLDLVERDFFGLTYLQTNVKVMDRFKLLTEMA